MSARGDGIAMAWRAGCRVANWSSTSSTPPACSTRTTRNFLLTEALRGEGAYLRRPDGSRFMPEFRRARPSWRPRDIVARAIDHEMKRLGADCMYLDISHKPADFVIKHFPTIYERCLTVGIDITKEAIPIVPAGPLHLWRRDDRPQRPDRRARPLRHRRGLLHRSARRQPHGLQLPARMRGVCPCRRRRHSGAVADEQRTSATTSLGREQGGDSDEAGDRSSTTGTNCVCLCGTTSASCAPTSGLARAKRRIDLLKQEVQEYYANFRVSNNLLELRNLLQVAELIVNSALRAAKEFRGLHYNLDYPEQLPNPTPTILIPDNF